MRFKSIWQDSKKKGQYATSMLLWAENKVLGSKNCNKIHDYTLHYQLTMKYLDKFKKTAGHMLTHDHNASTWNAEASEPERER
jgi:hypothetical protein